MEQPVGPATVTIIRPIRKEDREAWLPLWRGYNDFYRNEPTDEVTHTTFRRLCEGSDGLYGLVAEDDGALLGLAHAVFHPSTWTTGTYCLARLNTQMESLLLHRPTRSQSAHS